MVYTVLLLLELKAIRLFICEINVFVVHAFWLAESKSVFLGATLRVKNALTLAFVVEWCRVTKAFDVLRDYRHKETLTLLASFHLIAGALRSDRNW